MTYDANGNILTASGKTYTYNASNRMATSNDGSATTSYLINFMGQRTQKSNTTDSTSFIYDENDNVIAEYDAAGNLTNEYIYLDNRPVALLRGSNLYYIYTDHLNTPRAITDTANNLQWTWENKEAFGNNAPTEVVTGFKFNFRLPGQYFDSETNLNYNIHRDYNPVWGRYISSDPLGLAAGINTYGYVSGNSLRSSDKLGLKCDARGCWETTDEGSLRKKEDVNGYYRLACQNGDKYACNAGRIAANDGSATGIEGLLTQITNVRLSDSVLSNLKNPTNQQILDSLTAVQRIKLGLSWD